MDNQEGLKHLFCDVDLLVMPCRTRSFGFAALEALSARLPVLVSGYSGLGEALQRVLFASSYVNLASFKNDFLCTLLQGIFYIYFFSIMTSYRLLNALYLCVVLTCRQGCH